MKVLFLEIDTESTWSLAAMGPAWLAASVRPRGHGVEMLRVPLELSAAEVAAQVRRERPDLLALSLTTRQWLRAREVVAAVREELEVPVVAGGLHPTFAAQEVLASPGFDAVCLGEGEAAFGELLEALEAGGGTPATLADLRIPNLQVRGGPRPAIRPPVASLDALPFPARDLLDEPPGVAHVTTRRGCPFPCTYCAASSYDRLYRGAAHYGRRRSPGHVLAELAEIERRRGLSYVIFLDDTFTLDRGWVETFCRRYGEEVGLPFSIHARVETVDEELLGVLAAAGCDQVTYGVESGSERVRREVMRRPVADRWFFEVFGWSRKAGLRVTANYMLGVPGETRADLEATLALAEGLGADDFGYFVFYPYPGTPLFDLCRERGYLPAGYRELPAGHRRSILDLPGLSREEIAEVYDRFTALRERLWAERHPGAATEHVRQVAAVG